MNVILLEADDFSDEGSVCLRDRRHHHVRTVHRASVGDVLRVGRVDGLLGHGVVTRLDREALELRVTLDEVPPPPLAITLVVALPRPPSMRKVLQQGAAMGVKRFVFVHCARTEKSYWSAKAREPAAISGDLLLGLEQGRDSVVPEVEFHRRFAGFLAERFPSLRAESQIFVADPRAAEPCPRAAAGPVTLVLGPEGGFIPVEVEQLRAGGARCVLLGPRILRVETAVVAMLARFAPW